MEFPKSLRSNVGKNKMKCTHGKGSAALQQREGWRRWSFSSTMDSLGSAFWGRKGLPLQSRDSTGGWLQFGAAAGVWWDLEQLIFHFINGTNRHPSTLLVCLVRGWPQSLLWVEPSFQCKDSWCQYSRGRQSRQTRSKPQFRLWSGLEAFEVLAPARGDSSQGRSVVCEFTGGSGKCEWKSLLFC